MKKIIYIYGFLYLLFSINLLESQAQSLNTIDNEVFKQSIKRFINSAQNDKLNSLKGEQIEVLVKTNGKVERWKALDSLPGQLSGYITQSFCTSYRAAFAEGAQLSEEFNQGYEAVKRMLNSSLSKVDWWFHEDTKEDGTKRLSISSLVKADTFVKPNLMLEIVNKNGKYILQLSIII